MAFRIMDIGPYVSIGFIVTPLGINSAASTLPLPYTTKTLNIIIFYLCSNAS